MCPVYRPLVWDGFLYLGACHEPLQGRFVEPGLNHFSDSERFIQLLLELVDGIQALFCIVRL